MLKGVTTWIADAVTGKSGSPFRADMMTWQARFGLDVVRHAEALDWCSGICLDGPLAGKPVCAEPDGLDGPVGASVAAGRRVRAVRSDAGQRRGNPRGFALVRD
jgi:hypothetical protein